jgi:hypothetical protein
MQIRGRCLCGQASYAAIIDPRRVFICHCTDCQTQSGTVFRTVALANPDDFELTSGRLTLYEKQAESGASRVLAFCPQCGTSLYGGPGQGGAGLLSLRVGAILERAELVPVAQLWCHSALPWLNDLATLPRIEKQVAPS